MATKPEKVLGNGNVNTNDMCPTINIVETNSDDKSFYPKKRKVELKTDQVQNIEKINSSSFLQVTSMQNIELTMPSHVLEREEVEDELSQKTACEKSLNQYKVPKPESEIGEVLVSKTFPRDTEKQEKT